MKSLLLVLLLIVLQGTCSPLSFRRILSRSTSSNSRNVQTFPARLLKAGRTSVRMSTAFDEFRRQAEDILPKRTDDKTTSKVAFHLMQLKMEMEKKLELQEMEKKLELQEMEKKLELQEMEMEMEKKLELQEMEKKLELQEMKNKLELQKMESDNKQRQSTAFHSKQLSAVVQRLVVCLSVRIVNLFVFFPATYPIISSLHLCSVFRQVFESFLKDVVEAYKSGTGPIFDAVGHLDAADTKIFCNAATARFPSMSAIDKTVRIPAMQVAVWKHFRFEQHVEYPALRGDLLYGTLSNAVHNKVYKEISVSDMADDSYKRFLGLLGKIYLQTVVEYSEMDASTYEDEHERKPTSGDGDGDEKEH